MIGVGAAALAAIAIAVVISAVVHRPSHQPLVMTAGSTSSTTAAGPQGGAGAEATEVQQLVASVRRPPGATAMTGCPTLAAQPAQPLPRTTAATGSRCWQVSDSRSQVVAWERRHGPPHMDPAGTVRDGSVRAPTAIGLLYQLGKQGGVELSVYPSGDGSVLRVDAYVRAAATAARVG